MTRAEQLAFCNQCVNRKMDLEKGMLCSFTNERANFDPVCEKYEKDPTYINRTTPVEAGLQITSQQFEKLKTEQNLPLGITAALITGIVGSILWALITNSTGYQIGYMAVAIGFAVGFVNRVAGKGVEQYFGIIGASIALLSCVVGNFLSIIGMIADSEGLGYMETLNLFDWSLFFPIMAETFSVMDILFYGFAAYGGYKYSFRNLEPEDLQ
ncbi:hypothetical protein AAT17_12045 [Nonlabens sp. MIC269]|uniref:hypothetical protein n=1 Tax=Nonlabens sp. MIC269 TaxID=1476901 RepID=UPI00071F1B15|nr:hypothetical protein [Nonlabens sp. MIC269]ALM21915.1 hypothetical protein AAT17_12045 [Nonlabens sp. MIC269]